MRRTGKFLHPGAPSVRRELGGGPVRLEKHEEMNPVTRRRSQGPTPAGHGDTAEMSAEQLATFPAIPAPGLLPGGLGTRGHRTGLRQDLLTTPSYEAFQPHFLTKFSNKTSLHVLPNNVSQHILPTRPSGKTFQQILPTGPLHKTSVWALALHLRHGPANRE